MTARIRRARVLGVCFTAGLYSAIGQCNAMLGAVLVALELFKPSEH